MSDTGSERKAAELKELIIRDLQESDVEAVSAIEERTFSMPWKPADFLEMVRADYAHYYVAELGGRIVGCCGIRNMAGDGEITNVVVDEAYRDQKIGRRMMEYMLLHATDYGIGDCTLEVRVSNARAIHLYESLGFKGEGVRPDFYEKPKEDALIMWKR